MPTATVQKPIPRHSALPQRASLVSRVLEATGRFWSAWRRTAFVASVPKTVEQEQQIEQVKVEHPELAKATVAADNAVSESALLQVLAHLQAKPEVQQVAAKVQPQQALTSIGLLPRQRVSEESLNVEGLHTEGFHGEPVHDTFRALVGTPGGVPLHRAGSLVASVKAQAFVPVFANPNREVVAGHGMVERRDEGDVYRCRCTLALGDARTTRDAARAIMKAHRDAVR